MVAIYFDVPMASEGNSFGILAVTLMIDGELLANTRQLFMDIPSGGR